MAAVTEDVVREYFEQLGYLVLQPRKHTVPGRPKKPEEELDLVVHNPTVKEHELPSSFVWTTTDLKTVARAMIGVHGWHTERIYASTIEQAPELLRFVEPESVKYAGRLLGATDMAKILCLPKLPASGVLKDRTIRMLKERGVDGVIPFRTMLAELVRRVETTRNYEKSDTLQVIRLLKVYELVRNDQMELFATRRRKRPAARAGAKSAKADTES